MSDPLMVRSRPRSATAFAAALPGAAATVAAAFGVSVRRRGWTLTRGGNAGWAQDLDRRRRRRTAPTLTEQLELNGEFVAVACDSGAQAIELADGRRFDAILLDVGLPDMDGRELCRLLRGQGDPGADHHADRRRQRSRHGSRPRCRGRRLCDQAVPPQRAVGAAARQSAAERTQ